MHTTKFQTIMQWYRTNVASILSHLLLCQWWFSCWCKSSYVSQLQWLILHRPAWFIDDFHVLETSPKLCIICCMCVIYTQEQIICECLPKKLNNRPLFLSNNTFQHSWHFVACTMPPASTVGDFEWFLPITWVALLRDTVTTSTPYALRSPCKIRNLLIPHIFILILCFKILNVS